MEAIWFIYGIWIGNRFIGVKKFTGRGKKDSVNFDWKKGANPFVLGWMHTHPDSYGCNPSSTDNKTMRSWVKGLGRPMLCVIKCAQKTVWYFYYRDSDKSIQSELLKGHFKGVFAFGRAFNNRRGNNV